MEGSVIRAQERRTISINSDVYRKLSESSTVLELVSNGTISLVRSKSTPYGVRAYNKVGQVLLEDKSRLIIAEKVPGALRNLLNWALPDDIREMQSPSPVGKDSSILHSFAERFLHHIGEYLRQGRIKTYAYRLEKSPFPRGRINIAETARLVSKGKAGTVAYRRAMLTADLLPNRLLMLGLLAVEQYAATTLHGNPLRDRARGIAPLFGDVFSFTLVRSRPSDKSQAFDRAFADSRVSGHLRSALAFARALTLYLGAWPDTRHEEIPSSYFLNLEGLFEDAVRTAIASEVGQTIKVAKGNRWNLPLFSSRPDHYQADPDIVIGNALPPILIADCKYKDLDSQQGSGLPDHHDVYQLHTHCRTFGGPIGMLIFPGETYSCLELGQAADGMKLWFATVRINSLREDVQELLRQHRIIDIP